MEISADVYLVCLVQALSTEKEEVMGLLIGEVRFKPSAEVMQRLHFGPGLRLGSLYSQIKRAPLSLCCTELSLSCCIVTNFPTLGNVYKLPSAVLYRIV